MGVGDFVGLRCGAETLRAVATRLERYGPAEGAPEWLVSGVWLGTHEAHYLATASAEVLSNGYVARPLNIHRPDDLVREMKSNLPDVSARLIGRNGDLELSADDEVPGPPSSLQYWPARRYSAHVLVRTSRRHSRMNQVACALLMECEAVSLLVGTDPSTLAMALSEDPGLIERYRADCETLSVAEYLERRGD